MGRRGPNDPERRDRIAGAALDVASRDGVRGVSHRAVAAAADVPLGSTTYHFTGLEDLLEAATLRAVEHYRERLLNWSRRVEREGTAAPEAIADLVADLLGPGRDLMRVGYDLHFEALHRPALKEVSEAWAEATSEVLGKHVPAAAIRPLTVVLEGILVDRLLGGVELGEAEVASLIQAVLAGSYSTGTA